VRGPKPRPVEVKKREGNPGKRKLPEPVIVSGRPLPAELDEPPEHLPIEAKEFWREYISRLVEVGIVDLVDVPALEMLATMYARARQASRVVAKEGHYTRGSTGQIVEHPALKIERESMSQFWKMAEHFAFTPVARVRLGMAELQRKSLHAEMHDVLGPSAVS
jgi:P27 family predicted phage terminase small subunit